MKRIWILAVLVAISAIMLPASIAAKEQCTCSAEMQAKILVMENALASMKALCTTEAARSEEEVVPGSGTDLDLEMCSVSSSRTCYTGTGEFDEEEVFACTRREGCAEPEEEIAAGEAALALSEISAEDRACYNSCNVDISCYIKELNTCWGPDAEEVSGEEEEAGPAPLQPGEERYTISPGQSVYMCGNKVMLLEVEEVRATLEVGGEKESIHAGDYYSFDGVKAQVVSVQESLSATEKSKATIDLECLHPATKEDSSEDTPKLSFWKRLFTGGFFW